MNIDELSERLAGTGMVTRVAPEQQRSETAEDTGIIEDQLKTSALCRIMSASQREITAAHRVRPERVRACLADVDTTHLDDSTVDTILRRMFGG